MIVGYHVIFATYGFWLPNDPRGSWSDFVGSWELFRHGPANKTNQRQSLAHNAHNREKRLQAKQAMRDSPVQLTGPQARAVARGFAAYIAKSALPVWACAVMPDHVHLVVGDPRMPIERVVIQLKQAATQRLLSEGIHPRSAAKEDSQKVPKCFVRGHWKVYLDPQDVQRAVRYVEQNPVKEGKRKQNWSFVTAYPETWMQ